jgi:hypothetical protein
VYVNERIRSVPEHRWLAAFTVNDDAWFVNDKNPAVPDDILLTADAKELPATEILIPTDAILTPIDKILAATTEPLMDGNIHVLMDLAHQNYYALCVGSINPWLPCRCFACRLFRYPALRCRLHYHCILLYFSARRLQAS